MPDLNSDHPSPPQQTFSFYPSIPGPIALPTVRSAPHACSYFPQRQCQLNYQWADELPAAVYQQAMDAGFRRSGKLIYQPRCRGCRLCVPIRVPVQSFTPSKSQRRCWRRNQDLQISVGEPTLTDEKFALYATYLKRWHQRDVETEAAEHSETARESLREFLYESPVRSLEFEYRSSHRRLLAVGICDVCALESLSSVYFFFDPQEHRRGLGTFGAMVEIEAARQRGAAYYYLGYWIEGSRTMQYKSKYRPFELLHGDGVWRRGSEAAAETAADAAD